MRFTDNYAATIFEDTNYGGIAKYYFPLDEYVGPVSNALSKFLKGIPNYVVPPFNSSALFGYRAAGPIGSSNAINFLGGANDYFRGNNSFPATSSYNSTLMANSPRSLMAWIRTTQSSSYAGIFLYGAWTYACNFSQFGLCVHNGIIHSGPYNNCQTVNSGLRKVNDGLWHLVAITHDGTTSRVYVDGIQSSAFNITYRTNQYSDNSIGAWCYVNIGEASSSGFGSRFLGQICRISLYNYTLTSSRLMQHYLAGIGSLKTVDHFDSYGDSGRYVSEGAANSGFFFS